MSALGPPLHSRGLWATREAKCLSIIAEALTRLRNSPNLPEAEVELNREFYFLLVESSRHLYPDDEIAPIPECNNQPDPDDEARAKRELKRPDFQWIYLDRYEGSSRHSSKQFVVECKRLGKAIRTDWVFNVNYVHHGIMRFKVPDWAYAKRFPSGAMVGYWQSMDAHDVLGEVNEEADRKLLPKLILVGAWSPGGVSRCEQLFERPFEISPFHLHHLWIDLRENGGRATSTSASVTKK
jgi:hypothetical protein